MKIRICGGVLAFASLLAAADCLADPPDTYLIGVQLSLSTSIASQSVGYRKERPFQLSGLTPVGYLTMSALEMFDENGNLIAAAEVFKKLRSSPEITFCPHELLHEILIPQSVVALADENGCPHINIKSVLSIEPWKGNLDGAHGYAWPVTLAPRLIDLLSHKKPVFWCPVGYAESLYWISYNPEVAESSLGPICKRTPETAPTKEETSALKAKAQVFLVAMPYD